MDADAEKLCRKCYRCHVTGEPSKPEPHSRVVPPSGPWKDCAINLLELLPSDESTLVTVDYFGRFFEIAILKSVTSEKNICALRLNFARFGLPISLKNNNGPQLVSHEFKQFLRKHNNKHYSSVPQWPQENGAIESQNKTVMKAIRKACVETTDWRVEIGNFLTA